MNASEMLKQNNFRATAHRVVVLELFMQSKRAFSHSDLENYFEKQIDRVSIYRILHSFNEAKLVCKLFDSAGKVSYVFDQHSTQKNEHHHPHFKCRNCNEVTELPELPQQYLKQLKKMKIDSLNILAEGTCKKCEKEKV